MKNLFYLLILFLSVFESLAQTPWCVTKAPTQTEKTFLLQKFQAFESQRARMSAEGVKNIALKVHLLSSSNGSIEFSESSIKELVDTLNFHFIHAGIQFYLCSGVNYISYEDYNRFNSNNEEAFCNKYDVNNAINLYLVKSFSEADLGGYARLPTPDKETNRILAAYKNPSVLISKIIPHEMGHYFGLLHTFEGAGIEGYSEFVTRDDKANCSYRGDLICDTPADPSNSISYQIENCKFISNAVDPNGDSYDPQLGNLMSYYRGCGNFFTPGQIAMIKTGLLLRLVPNENKTRGYTIDCQGGSGPTIVMGNVYLDGQQAYGANDFCVEKPFTVKFSTNGNFDKGNEFVAYIIADNRTYSAEIGRSITNEIECRVPKDAPTKGYYRIKVEATKPNISGILSYAFYYVVKPATVEINGEYDLFDGETLKMPVKTTGGVLNLLFENRPERYYLYPEDKFLSLKIKQSEVLKVKRAYNQCGDATVKGEAIVNVIAKPLANRLLLANFNQSYICPGKVSPVSILANGVFEKNNTFKALLSDSKGENFKEINIEDNSQNLLNLKFPDNLPEGNGYRVKILSSNPALEVNANNLSVFPKTLATLSGDTTILNGNQAMLPIRFKGLPPFSFETSEGQKYTINENSFIWAVAPGEQKSFSLKSVSNASCGNGQVQGSALVKVNYPISLSTLQISSVCAGSKLTIGFNSRDNISDKNGIQIQLSDSQGKNFKSISSIGETVALSFIIPEDTPDGLNYRLRLISKDGLYIGNESNEFEIQTKPSAILNQSALGFKGEATQIPVKLTGGGLWHFSVSTGDSTLNYTAQQNPFFIPVIFSKNKVYQLTSVSNACGEGKVSGKSVINVRENTEKYCIPKVTDRFGYVMGQISLFRLKDAHGNVLINNYELSTGKDFYTDNTSTSISLQPGSTYTYNILGNDYGTEDIPRANGFTGITMWIDYNQNGKFEKNENIVVNALQLADGSFTVPNDVKKGLTRLRIRGLTLPDDWDKIIDNPCLNIDWAGETEDYTIYFTDDSPDYPIQVDFDAQVLCKRKEHAIAFTYASNFPETTVFKAALYNSFGQLITYLGESKTSPIKFKLPDDIPIGQNYRLKIIASEFQQESVFTKAFRINDIATATLTGNQRAFIGEKINFSLILDGGAEWYYSVGSGGGWTMFFLDNKTIINVPAYYGTLSPKPGDYYFRVNYIYNDGCDDGVGNGEVKVELYEPDGSPTITAISNNLVERGFQQYHDCLINQYNETIVTFTANGKFDRENYFSCHLFDPQDKFVAVIGYSKTNQMSVSFPKNIAGYGYKLRIVSSSPYIESNNSESFLIAPKTSAQISGYSEIMPGEQGVIKLDLEGMEPWEITLSDGTTFTTNLASQYLKVSPNQTQTYSVLKVKGKYCVGEVSGTATVKVLKPRATRIALKQLNEICIGTEAKANFQSDGSFRDRNDFKLYLTNKQGNLLKTINARIINDSTMNFIIPDDVPPGKDYSLKLITTSPYLESELIGTFTLKPSGVAIISSDVKSVYEKSPIRLRIDFTGEGPYTIELSDGSKYENITQNPYFIDLKATLGISKYTIRQLLNSCGQGKATGSVELNIIPLPLISTERLPVNIACPGSQIFVPFKVSNGVFLADNVFKVELLHIAKNKLTDLQTIIKGDSLFALIPSDATAGVHSIRVNGTAPLSVGSFSASELLVKNYATATINGNSTVISGDSASFQLVFAGDSPWGVGLSNGIELKNIIQNSLVVKYLPQKSETITISSVKNACGEGSFQGDAVIKVLLLTATENDEIEKQVEIYPIPFEQSTSLYITPSLLKQSVEFEISDILGRRLMKLPVFHSKTPIDLNFYPPGMYYVRVITNEKQFLRKIVK